MNEPLAMRSDGSTNLDPSGSDPTKAQLPQSLTEKAEQGVRPVPCYHNNLHTNVQVEREEETGEPVTATIQIYCKDCNVPLGFVGLSPGKNPDGPTTDPLASQARLPVAMINNVIPPTALGTSRRKRK